MNDIFVRVIDFPSTDVKGIIKEDPDGDYNVYLNARYNDTQQVMTWLHELEHAKLGHLHSDLPVELIEKEANEKRDERVKSAAFLRVR